MTLTSRPTASAQEGLAVSTPGMLGTATRAAWRATAKYRPVLVIVVLMFTAFSLTQDHFFASNNLQNLLVSISGLWVVALGMTFVLISGSFDLSVGANAGLCGVIFAHLVSTESVPGGLALLIAVLSGVLIGGVANGVLIGPLKLSSFVVTLASMSVLTGVVQIWTNTNSIAVFDPVTDFLATGTVLGLAPPVAIMVITFAAALYVQRYTYLGRDFYAVGGNQTAAQLAGISGPRTTVVVFAIVGGCAALAGVMSVARIGAATPQVDINLGLLAIAAVLLGGTSIIGGSGGIGGTVVGVLFIGVLQNGLSIAGVQSYWQLVVTGVILASAVAGDRLRTGRRAQRTVSTSPTTPAVDPDPGDVASHEFTLSNQDAPASPTKGTQL